MIYRLAWQQPRVPWSILRSRSPAFCRPRCRICGTCCAIMPMLKHGLGPTVALRPSPRSWYVNGKRKSFARMSYSRKHSAHDIDSIGTKKRKALPCGHTQHELDAQPIEQSLKIVNCVQPGSINCQIGAMRYVSFGNLGFVDQLEALDDEKHIM